MPMEGSEGKTGFGHFKFQMSITYSSATRCPVGGLMSPELRRDLDQRLV